MTSSMLHHLNPIRRTPFLYIHSYIPIHTHTHIPYICIYTYIYTHIYTYVCYIYLYIYIHTYIHSSLHLKLYQHSRKIHAPFTPELTLTNCGFQWNVKSSPHYLIFFLKYLQYLQSLYSMSPPSGQFGDTNAAFDPQCVNVRQWCDSVLKIKQLLSVHKDTEPTHFTEEFHLWRHRDRTVVLLHILIRWHNKRQNKINQCIFDGSLLILKNVDTVSWNKMLWYFTVSIFSYTTKI